MLLAAPLFLFTLAVFVVPIVLILTKAVDNPEVVTGLPRTSTAIGGWSGAGDLPSDEVFRALIADLGDRSPAAARNIAAAARRLNYEMGGFRSLLIASARGAKSAGAATDARQTLLGIDPRWGEVGTWTAIKRAAPVHTAYYTLAALDLRQDSEGGLERVSPDQRAYVDVLLRTLRIAGVTTLICLILGYPLAAVMASASHGFAAVLLGAVLLPFWTSLLAKTSSWIVILQQDGPVNKLLMLTGLTSAPVPLIFNSTGLYIVMAHMMLPFTVLPIYSTMKGVPGQYMRASSSLGAHPIRGFLNVYLPMTMPGIGAGALLTFIVSAGYYVTPSLVGSPREQMLGYFVAYYAYTSINWGLAAALSLVLLACVLALYLLAGRFIGVRQIAGLK
ncbi:ABC transporter permease [Ancylobacter sp.]|uniref:ABC transporter permease n=1 Tax=Ancylobacter sp. TaxID=1872567 RepID=UPI003C7A3131